MRDENSPNDYDCRDDCIGKQHGGWMSVVATAGAAYAAGFPATAAATADPDSGSGEIDCQQINYVVSPAGVEGVRLRGDRPAL